MLMMIAGNEDADDVDDDNDDDDNDDDDDDDDKKSWSKQKWQSKQMFPRFSRRSAQILQQQKKLQNVHFFTTSLQNVYAHNVYRKIFLQNVYMALCALQDIFGECE